MIDFDFPTNLILITKSFLSEKTFKVICNGSYSTIRSIRAGVPQGAVLSPTLYNIYTADIHVCTTMFADDTSFYKTALHHLTTSSKLKVASRSIETKNEIPTDPIKVFGTCESCRLIIKLLGVHLDKRLTFKYHIENVTRKANNAIRTLYLLINRKSKLHITNKLLLYKLAIRPILTYGYPAFHGIIAATHTRKLQTLQNRTLKMILDRPWWESTEQIHAETKLPWINDYLQKRLIQNL
ncbi:hypothetical protein PVAND_004256 [Polypedilum vanderplanki]|uniref:Reverse transcriptase domain-containing protein n=1 Tax=Polypedilum vanderplanki TaxID=319348 RepID=A0A9J6BWK9_POLVA|nr:hypothetical protein PVAND_004256 [Polypedilum vanderplanki]